MAQPTAERTHALALPANILAHGSGDGLTRVALTYRGADNFEVTATPRHTAGSGLVELAHRERRPGDAMTVYCIRVMSTAQPFGGVRWWFICPATGRRVTKLWLPLGADRFASRQAWGLGYGVQRISRLDRLDRRADRIYRALAGPTQWRDGIPPKPRYMRWPTYSRRALALRHAIAVYEAAWAGGVFRRFPGLR